MSSSVTLLATEDTNVDSFYFDRNYNNNGLGWGRDYYSSDTKDFDKRLRSFIKFNLRDLGIPPEAVTMARLLLYGAPYRVQPQYGVSVPIARVFYTEGPWREGNVTWRTQPGPTELDGVSFMGETTDMPPEGNPGWIRVNLDVNFIKHSLGSDLSVIMKGTENPVREYVYACDTEDTIAVCAGVADSPLLRIYYQEGANLVLHGRCTGGYPVPDMLLETYVDGALTFSRNVSAGTLEIDVTYDLAGFFTAPGTHDVYGRMVLTNAFGSFEFTTPTQSFTI